MVSDKVFNTDGIQRIFGSDFDIISEDHLRVFFDGVVQSRDDYDLINNAAVFVTAPTTGQVLTLQVGTTPGDILTAPTDAGIVAANIVDINTVADNTTNINIVSDNISDVNLVADNMTEILLVDDNAAAAAASAVEAATSAANAAISESAAQSSEDDAETAQVAAETAETAAETAQVAAETAETAAEASQTAAAASQASATASAASATASATSAGSSAADAQSSEDDAEVSQIAAAASAVASAGSATASSTSASAASTSETNAANSATASSSSATAAATSEANAATSETNAATSETNAAASETAAATSASNAATSETNAAISASAAASSATAASTSESNAATSASAASTSETNAATSEANAAASEASVASIFDTFDDTYLGAKNSDPSVDNDGDPLAAGMLYTNTTSGRLRYYTGSSWEDAAISASSFVQKTGDTMTGDLTAPTFIGNLDGAVASGVKNGATTTLLKGTPVYQTSTAGNNAVVEAADASNAATMPAIGVLAQDLTAGQEVDSGGLIHLGFIQGVDTSSFSEGDTIYVASGGGYTNVAPTGEGNLIQNLGKVIKVHASNGSGIVMGAGRSNATPNLNDGNVFIGNASNQAEARALQIADTTNLQTTLDGKEDAGTAVAMAIALG